MEDAALMGVMNGPDDRQQELYRVGRVQFRTPLQHPGEAGPLNELHHVKVLPLVTADLINGHDIGMVQLDGGLHLSAEALQLGGRGPLPGEDHLQGHQPIEPHVSGLENHPHAAPGDLLQQLVIAEGARQLQGHGASGPRGLVGHGGHAPELGQRPQRGGQLHQLFLRAEERG
jgi:hypothetical protein